MRNQKVNIGVVGATGLVGKEILTVLEERGFPVNQLRLFASERSAGQSVEYAGKQHTVEELKEDSFASGDLDYVLFAGGGKVSEKFCPLAAQSGAVVIDNSSHFRLEKGIPLVVPEVNPETVIQAKERGIIANPNCSTIQMVVCLKALHEVAGLKRVVVSTYQAVSGAGAEAMEELRSQVGGLFGGGEIKKNVFPHQIAFNCLPHIDVFYENGMTKEEMKMIHESRKILDLPDLKITATAVRIPVFIGHSESVNLEFESEIDLEEARRALSEMPGVVVIDEPQSKIYPTAMDVSGKDQILVGRIRKDESVENGLHLWIVADNLRKGAATNAVQIAEICLQQNFTRQAA